jgi:hypothetical protein
MSKKKRRPEELPVHPVCSLFPLLRGAAYEQLKADIEAHGVREPIWTWRGQIIDGRTATVFERPAGWGCYSWCVANSEGPRYCCREFLGPWAAVQAMEATVAMEAAECWGEP